jgi:hypothetical protein
MGASLCETVKAYVAHGEEARVPIVTGTLWLHPMYLGVTVYDKSKRHTNCKQSFTPDFFACIFNMLGSKDSATCPGRCGRCFRTNAKNGVSHGDAVLSTPTEAGVTWTEYEHYFKMLQQKGRKSAGLSQGCNGERPDLQSCEWHKGPPQQ